MPKNFRYLLRESGVPPYFLNMLGGAIWWEVNHLVDVAAGDGQKKTTQCICAADMDLKHDEVGHKEGHGEIGGETTPTTNRQSRTKSYLWDEETKEPSK